MKRYTSAGLFIAGLLFAQGVVSARGFFPPPQAPTGFSVSTASGAAIAQWNPIPLQVRLAVDDRIRGEASGLAGQLVIPHVNLAVPHVFKLSAILAGLSSEPAIFNYTPPPLAPTNAEKNQESLNQLRSALSVFYGDTEGEYPTDLHQLIPKYLSVIPAVECGSSSSNIVTNAASPTLTYTGGWLYVNSLQSPEWGQAFINCPVATAQ